MVRPPSVLIGGGAVINLLIQKGPKDKKNLVFEKI